MIPHLLPISHAVIDAFGMFLIAKFWIGLVPVPVALWKTRRWHGPAKE